MVTKRPRGARPEGRAGTGSGNRTGQRKAERKTARKDETRTEEPDRRDALSVTRTDLSIRGEQRYARGERRTDAEPLTASWHPGAESSQVRRAGRRGYGWRVYVIPLLVVITVLVVINTARDGSPLTFGGLGADTTATTGPAATEGTATAVNVTGGTAVLPTGGAYPRAGAGTWRVLPGSGPVAGRPGARVYHYRIAVEDGIDASVFAGDDAFARTVNAILADPRGWIAAGSIAVQWVDASFPDPDFTIALTTPNTDHRPDMCGFEIQFEGSCWLVSTKQVVINVARWVRGAMAFDGDLGLYREYAINHEVGHVFGNHHVGCATEGGLAPVMMEQTFGVSDDYVYDVNNPQPANRGAVQRDDRTCRVNAWPYPQGGDYSPDAPPG